MAPDRRIPDEVELLERERWLADSQRAGGVGCYHFDLPSGVWKSTPVMDEIFGIGPDYPRTFEGWVGLIAPEQREEMAAYYASITSTGAGFDREYRLLRASDGTERWVHGRGEFIRDASGAIVSMIGTIMDVTVRKQAEEALRRSEEKFAKVFRQAPLLMTLSDVEDGRYVDVNRMFCEVSGFARDEAIGRTSTELGWITAQDRERIIGTLRKEGRITNLEMTLSAKGGRRVDCIYSGELVTVDGRERLLSIALDVTEKNRMQEQLDRIQRLESLGVLAGGIAHDFNNFLAAILGNLSFVRHQVGKGNPVDDRLAECEQATVRAGELTNQLLTFARGGAPVRERMNLGALLREIVPFALRGSDVRGNLDLAPDLWCLDADRGQVGQLFNNLLINAKQAMPGGGTVTVRAFNEIPESGEGRPLPGARYVAVVVRDEGEGIPSAHIDRIFDPYFTTKPEGSGLGLASVHSIVRRHGGSVEVSSPPGAGAEFRVRLPAAEGPAEPCGKPEAPEEMPTGGGRVLVMDDEPMLSRLATEMLAELGYAAEACADGKEAIARFRQAREAGDPFTTVILDLTVPGGMGGREAAARILEIDPGARLIVSSGYSNDPVLAEPAAFGFCGVVAKPYSMRVLALEMARLRESLPG